MTAPPFAGLSRVVHPPQALPQAAEVLDLTQPLAPEEIEIEVRYLNLDSASFHDLRSQHDGDSRAMREEMLAIVGARGKMVNPRTGSGGMLVGRVSAVGDAVADLSVGDDVATLISLTATPLAILDGLVAWDAASEIVPTCSRAVLPTSRTVVRLPADLSESVALSVLDVCGAPAYVRRLAERAGASRPLRRVMMLGGGKSAVLSAAMVRRAGAVAVGVVPTTAEAERLRALDLFDEVLVADARAPLAVREAVLAAGGLPDTTLVCVNVPDCEQSALAATEPGGAIVYFSMATSFARVALGAEALCLDFDLYFGTGYLPGHAELALELVQQDPRVRRFFEDVVITPAG